MLPGYVERFVVIFLADEAGEAGRAGDIGAFADVDEQRIGVDPERFESRKATGGRDLGNPARFGPGEDAGHRADMFGRRSATAADDIHEASAGEIADDFRHLLRRLVVFAELVRQAGIRMRSDMNRCEPRYLFHMGRELFGAEGAIEADRKRFRMQDRIAERFDGLARQSAAAGVGNRARYHQRQAFAGVFEEIQAGMDRRLRVQGIERGFDQQQVGAAFDEGGDGDGVVFGQFVKGNISEPRIVDIGRNRGRLAGRADDAGDETRLLRRARVHFVAGGASQPRTRQIQLSMQSFHAVIGLGTAVGIEGIGFDDIGPGLQVSQVNIPDQIGSGQVEKVIVSAEIYLQIAKTLAAKVRLAEAPGLDHRAHGAVEQHDAPLKNLFQTLVTGGFLHGRGAAGRKGRQFYQKPLARVGKAAASQIK